MLSQEIPAETRPFFTSPPGPNEQPPTKEFPPSRTPAILARLNTPDNPLASRFISQDSHHQISIHNTPFQNHSFVNIDSSLIKHSSEHFTDPHFIKSLYRPDSPKSKRVHYLHNGKELYMQLPSEKEHHDYVFGPLKKQSILHDYTKISKPTADKDVSDNILEDHRQLRETPSSHKNTELRPPRHLKAPSVRPLTSQTSRPLKEYRPKKKTKLLYRYLKKIIKL